jgi:hypothetical protein
VHPVTGSIATAAGALEGGVLVLHRTTVREVDGSGVYVAEADTHATLEDVRFERVGRAAGTEHGSVAVARDGATLTWTGGGATESTAVVLEAAGGAVHASDLEIDGIAAGVRVGGFDTEVGAGMLASGGSLEAEAVAVAGATGLGALLAGEATARLVDVSFHATAPHPDGSPPTDLFVAQGARLVGERVMLASDDARGLWAQEPGTTVSLTEASAGPSSRLGLAAIDGATLDLHTSRVESRSRVGLYASGSGTALDLEEVVVDGTRARRGGRVHGVHGLRAAPQRGRGRRGPRGRPHAHGLGRARHPGRPGGRGLRRLGGDHGGAGALTVDGGRLEGNATAALWLTGPGAWRVVDTALSGGEGWAWRAGRVVHGDAIVARGRTAPWDGERGLWIDGATLRDAAGAGLLLHASGATLGEVSFAGNAADVWVQGCAAGEPVVEGLGDMSAEWCPEGDRLMLAPDIGNIVQLGGITSD